MAEQEAYVGVDVSKERLDVAVWPGDEFFSTPNDARAVRRVVQRLQGLNCRRIVLEATGGYETLLAGALWAAACRWWEELRQAVRSWPRNTSKRITRSIPRCSHRVRTISSRCEA